ncbi:MAG: hypothetical protein LBB56_06430 [Chitinispirillales bacterium]|jgi:hypothetical protein|nr:hypothetical protein [Chitinispirillales bacterium]
MRYIIKIMTAAFIFYCAAFAQESKPRIAFYFYGEEPKAGVFKPLGVEITKAIVMSGEYIAIDRTDAVRELITQEQLYQRSGSVDESQVSAFGKQWGVKYVITMEISRARTEGSLYIEARMVDVEGAYIAKMGTVTNRLESDKDLYVAANRIIDELLESPAKKKTPAKIVDENYENFTLGQRYTTGILNIVPGLGSLAIMNDYNGAAINAVLGGTGWVLVFAFWESDTDFTGAVGPIAVLASGVWNIYRSVTYNKKPDTNKKVSTNPYDGFNIAILPDKNGNLQAAAVYRMGF